MLSHLAEVMLAGGERVELALEDYCTVADVGKSLQPGAATTIDCLVVAHCDWNDTPQGITMKFNWPATSVSCRMRTAVHVCDWARHRQKGFVSEPQVTCSSRSKPCLAMLGMGEKPRSHAEGTGAARPGAHCPFNS
eukprot:437235-Amphidinium_carterae.1